MLDGLEIKEILFSAISKDNAKFRIDDEFYLKKYLIAYQKIEDLPYIYLKQEIEFLTDYHANGSYKSLNIHVDIKDEKDFAYMIRSTDLVKMDFTLGVKYVSEKAYNFLSKSKIYGGELLINKIGNPGNVYITPSIGMPVTLGMNLFMVRLRQKSLLNNYFLYVYFNSQIGQNIIYRNVNGTVPLTIDKEAIKNLPVPIFSSSFQLQIEKLVKSSHQKLEESKKFYKESEVLLLKELDLFDFKPSNENIATKTLSESFGANGRLDSEYYQPKYDEIIDKIKSYKGGFEILQTACALKDKNFTPLENKYYSYVELSNIGTTGDITGFTYEVGQDLPSRARRVIKENDVIISSIEGSLEKVALVTKEFSNSLCSTGFYVINSKKINSPTLLVLFKNNIFGQILKQNCSGTILTAMNKDEFLNMVIPIIDKSIQSQIEEKIKNSFELKEASKNLLELAKKAVEVAIEHNEEKALRLLSQYL